MSQENPAVHSGSFDGGAYFKSCSENTLTSSVVKTSKQLATSKGYVDIMVLVSY